jgi:hypothetical protein
MLFHHGCTDTFVPDVHKGRQGLANRNSKIKDETHYLSMSPKLRSSAETSIVQQHLKLAAL